MCLDKGCYLGQELTARTYFRGATRKRIVPLVVLGPIGSDAPYATAVAAAGPSVIAHTRDALL